MSQRNLKVPRKRVRRLKLDGQQTPILFKPEGLEQLDKRCLFARKLLKMYRQFKRESKCDSTAKDQLCRRAAFLSIQVESLECKALRGDESFDSGQLVNATNSLIGVLRLLGLEDRSRVKEVRLSEYISRTDQGKRRERQPVGALSNGGRLGTTYHQKGGKLRRYINQERSTHHATCSPVRRS